MGCGGGEGGTDIPLRLTPHEHFAPVPLNVDRENRLRGQVRRKHFRSIESPELISGSVVHPFESSRNLNTSGWRERECSAIKSAVVHHTECNPVLHLVWAILSDPLNMRSFDREALVCHLRTHSANGASMSVGLQNIGAEPGTSRNASRHLSRPVMGELNGDRAGCAVKRNPRCFKQVWPELRRANLRRQELASLQSQWDVFEKQLMGLGGQAESGAKLLKFIGRWNAVCAQYGWP